MRFPEELLMIPSLVPPLPQLKMSPSKVMDLVLDNCGGISLFIYAPWGVVPFANLANLSL